MPSTRTDRHEVDGQVVATTSVDITADVTLLDVHTKLRAALVANRAWLPQSAQNPAGRSGAPSNAALLGQVDKLTRQMNGLIRLGLAATGAPDLLLDETPDT